MEYTVSGPVRRKLAVEEASCMVLGRESVAVEHTARRR